MALDDVLISIDELDNSEMCSQSSNKFWQLFSKKIGLQIFLPSNFNDHTEVQVIEGELGRKPRMKSLEEDPNQLRRMSVDTNNWSLYKVPFPIREVNPKAYEPNVISIGPYHHGKKHLKTMEVIKRNCFSRMIKKSKVEAEKFVIAMKKLEKRVRECYEEPLDRFDSDTFVEMMVLDGCFIVLLFQNNDLLTSLRKLKKGIRAEIYCDLLLLENQLPFFVLFELYGVINMSNVKIDEFPELAFSHLSKALISGSDICLPKKFPKPKKIKHLLGLVHSSWLPLERKRQDAGAEEETETKAKEETETEIKTEPEPDADADAETEAKAEETKAQSLWKFICCGTEPEEKGIGRKGNCSRKFIRCSIELKEEGINFVNKGKELQDKDRKDKIGEEEQDKKRKASLFDIEFQDGKLKIPTLRVENNTERILRNFMAYEQFLQSSEPTYVCDYVTLMHNLINSGKDVQLLCNCGIIDNWLGDDEVVAQMFNKLGDFTYVSIDSDEFCYAEICDKVDLHCKRGRNKWKAKFNKDYFKSPWTIIKLLAAFFLLLPGYKLYFRFFLMFIRCMLNVFFPLQIGGSSGSEAKSF